MSGQNMLYADDKGNIGQVMALEYEPAAGRTGLKLLGDPRDQAELWGNPIKSTQLPAAFNPAGGFLASANNTPVKTDPPISLFTGLNDRYRRLADLAGEKAKRLELSDLKKMQQDVHSASSLALAREMAIKLTNPPQEAKGLVKALAAWDGDYSPESKGAAALELSAYHLAQKLYDKMYGPEAAAYLLRSPTVYRLLLDDLHAGRAGGLLTEAALAAAPEWREHPRWGDLHRLELAHPLSNAPLIGFKFRFGDYPWPGSSNTLFKSAHSLGNERHGARYGANARFVCDLGDMDENYFALLGGEDGYLGSVNYLDMFKLWQKGGYVRVPLREKSLRREFGKGLVLRPGGQGK